MAPRKIVAVPLRWRSPMVPIGRCFSRKEEPPDYAWFNFINLRTKATELSVSRSTTLLPCLPSTSLEHREKMFAARKAIRESDDKKAAERAGRHAAILIPLCMKEGKPAVLFTVRSHLVSTHKGQVSFPGGHTEPGESAPATAMREATEELGDGIGPIRLLARGTAIPALTGTLVHPVVGWVERDVGPAPHTHLHLCEAEVDRAFALTLDELLDPALQTAPDFASRVTPQRKEQDFSGPHPKRGKSGKWPVFLGEPNGAEVWGLTAFVLDSILRELIQPLRVQQRQE